MPGNLAVATLQVSNGQPSPSLDVASNSVFVPSSIVFTGTFYPADGSDPESFTDTWDPSNRVRLVGVRRTRLRRSPGRTPALPGAGGPA